MTHVRLTGISLERPLRFRARDNGSKVTPFTSPFILRNIDLSVSKGTRLGIFGMNGAGKTCLLKIIGGNLFPTSGSVDISGSIARIWNLSSGFDPRLSARENIRLYGILRDIPSRDIEFRMRKIEEFVDLGPYFDKPFTTLSNGMISRVLFTLATEWPASIVLIDEGMPLQMKRSILEQSTE